MYIPAANGMANFCTATIVSTNTILSAAHCFPGAQRNPQTGLVTNKRACIAGPEMYKGVCSDRVYIPPSYGKNNVGADLAVVTFNTVPFKHIFMLTDKLFDVRAVKTPVTMVGYSEDNPGPDFKNSNKRWGVNVISQFEPSEHNSIITPYRGNKSGVGLGQGDSGDHYLASAKSLALHPAAF